MKLEINGTGNKISHLEIGKCREQAQTMSGFDNEDTEELGWQPEKTAGSKERLLVFLLEKQPQH